VVGHGGGLPQGADLTRSAFPLSGKDLRWDVVYFPRDSLEPSRHFPLMSPGIMANASLILAFHPFNG
jgi:hypothetical protein